MRDLKPRKNISEIILHLKLSSFCCNSEKNRWQKTPKCWYLSNQLTKTTSIFFSNEGSESKDWFWKLIKNYNSLGDYHLQLQIHVCLSSLSVRVLTFFCMLIFLKDKSTLKVRFSHCISVYAKIKTVVYGQLIRKQDFDI